MSAEEPEAAFTQLPAEELASFSRWFEGFMADQWDKQVEADILADRLDAAGQCADADYQAGRCASLLLWNETALLSEQSLAQDWNCPEESAAWSHLRSDR